MLRSQKYRLNTGALESSGAIRTLLEEASKKEAEIQRTKIYEDLNKLLFEGCEDEMDSLEDELRELFSIFYEKHTQ